QGLLGIVTEFWNDNKEFNRYLQGIEKNQYTTRSTAKKNKLQKKSETGLDETERNLTIREKQLELEEREAELELKRLNIKKMKKRS
ncbi:16513_t:CDS:2, partial [Cetraspora pellucida]